MLNISSLLYTSNLRGSSMKKKTIIHFIRFVTLQSQVIYCRIIFVFIKKSPKEILFSLQNLSSILPVVCYYRTTFFIAFKLDIKGYWARIRTPYIGLVQNFLRGTVNHSIKLHPLASNLTLMESSLSSSYILRYKSIEKIPFDRSVFYNYIPKQKFCFVSYVLFIKVCFYQINREIV